MHALGHAGEHGGFIGRYVVQHGAGNHLKRAGKRRFLRKRDFGSGNCSGRLIPDQAVALLGFCPERESCGNEFRDRARRLEQVTKRAALELQLDLRQRRRIEPGADMAFVERQFDPAVARAERHYRAMDMGRENGIELAPQPLREQLLQGRAAGRPQIRLVAVDPLLPLAAADRDAVHGGLDGLDMLLAGLPHPKRHTVTPESMLWGVEIG